MAVHSFLCGRIPFLGIAAVIEQTLTQLPARGVHSFETLADADREARLLAGELIRSGTY
jgi:1-deoxy-D-xylulose-5-phosphate reductoisomerase